MAGGQPGDADTGVVVEEFPATHSRRTYDVGVGNDYSGWEHHKGAKG